MMQDHPCIGRNHRIDNTANFTLLMNHFNALIHVVFACMACSRFPAFCKTPNLEGPADAYKEKLQNDITAT
jgi:hypothetical protein